MKKLKMSLILVLLLSISAVGQFRQKPMLGSLISWVDSPSTKSLVGYWLLNEGSGKRAFDSSGNGKHGILTNGPTWDSGTFGSAVRMSGSEVTEDHIDIGQHALYSFGDMFNDRPFTFIVGYKADSDAVGHPLVIKADDTASANLEYAFSLSATAGFKPTIQINDDKISDREQIKATNVIANPTAFHQYATTYNGNADTSGLKLYVDGIEIATSVMDTGDYTAMHTGSAHLRIGASFFDNETSDTFADGLFEYVMIFDRVLSASEIALHYPEPFPEKDFTNSWKSLQGVGNGNGFHMWMIRNNKEGGKQ